MTDHTAKFPSTAFLEAHFGPDQRTSVILQATDEPLMVHDNLQREFQSCLIFRATHIMRRIIDTRGVAYQGIYVVRNGRLRNWALQSLGRKGFFFSVDAQKQIADELLAHYQHQPFRHDDWWRWFNSCGTLGARTAPHANPAGGNTPKVSLDDLFK